MQLINRINQADYKQRLEWATMCALEARERAAAMLPADASSSEVTAVAALIISAESAHQIRQASLELADRD